MATPLWEERVWNTWHQSWAYDICAMGATILAFGLAAPAVRHCLKTPSQDNATEKRSSLSVCRFLLMLDYAVEYSVMMRCFPLGASHTMTQMPSFLQLSLQVLAMLLLDFACLNILPVYSEDQQELDPGPEYHALPDQLSSYNIVALDFVAPKMSLLALLCVLELSRTAQGLLGSMHVVALGEFLLIRAVFGGAEVWRL